MNKHLKTLVAKSINRLVSPIGLRCVVKPEITAAVEINERCLENAKLLPNRWDGLSFAPKNGVVAEVGVGFGDFSSGILRVTDPSLFVTIDTFGLDRNSYKEKLEGLSHEEFYTRKFQGEIAQGRMQCRKGFSSEILKEYPDSTFDMIYVDAAHDYENVVVDLNLASQKIKPSGLIIMNDYTMLDPLLLEPYGVVQAVNEFIKKGGWEVVYLALHRYMFCDIALRKDGTRLSEEKPQ